MAEKTMTAKRKYLVKVNHPTGFHAGQKELTVSTNYGGKSVYVSGTEFGCSRDYAMDDVGAIRAFMAEHACAVASVTRIDPCEGIAP